MARNSNKTWNTQPIGTCTYRGETVNVLYWGNTRRGPAAHLQSGGLTQWAGQYECSDFVAFAPPQQRPQQPAPMPQPAPVQPTAAQATATVLARFAAPKPVKAAAPVARKPSKEIIY